MVAAIPAPAQNLTMMGYLGFCGEARSGIEGVFGARLEL